MGPSSFAVFGLGESDIFHDLFAVFRAADRASDTPLSIKLMAERLFAAFDAGERDPLRLKAAVLDRPVETDWLLNSGEQLGFVRRAGGERGKSLG